MVEERGKKERGKRKRRMRGRKEGGEGGGRKEGGEGGGALGGTCTCSIWWLGSSVLKVLKGSVMCAMILFSILV